MAFTYDPSTDVGKVRREIGDTKDASQFPGAGIRPDGSNFSDEDIQYYLDQNEGSIIGAAIALLTIVSTEYATRPSDISFGPYSESTKETMVSLRRQIAILERRYEEDKRKDKVVNKYSTVNIPITFTQ